MGFNQPASKSVHFDGTRGMSEIEETYELGLEVPSALECFDRDYFLPIVVGKVGTDAPSGVG